MWEMQAMSSSQGQNLNDLHITGVADEQLSTGVQAVLSSPSSATSKVFGNGSICRLNGSSESSLNNNNNNNNNTTANLANNCEQHTTVNGQHMQIDILNGSTSAACNTLPSNGLIIATAANANGCHDGISTSAAATHIPALQASHHHHHHHHRQIHQQQQQQPPHHHIPYGLEINSVLLDTTDGLLHPQLRETRAINIGIYIKAVFVYLS